jgi:hypothetical protein
MNSESKATEIINSFANSLHSYVLLAIRILLDIENKEVPDRSNQSRAVPYVSAVILISCVIDYLSKFRYGQVNGKGVDGNALKDGVCYKNFVKEYFIKENTRSEKTYNPGLIYEDVRCALAHGYSLGKEVILSHTNKYEKYHMEKHYIDEGGINQDRIVIDVFHFYYDLQYVCVKYLDEIMVDKKHLKEFMHRWNAHPFVIGYSENPI